MKTSAAGRALIVAREGRRLAAYRDTQGIWTIGVGHTGRMAGPPVTPGMSITEGQCDEFLAVDLAPVEAVIASAVTVPLSQNEFDAMASLGFNIGAAGLRRSSVVRRLNLGDVAGAADAFLMWSTPAVLAGRRKAERQQFLQPDAAVASARATRLAVAASKAKIAAKAGTSAGGALVAAGATAAPVVAATHHLGWALALGGLLVAVGLVAELAAALGHRRATTLAAGAGHQAGIAAGASHA